MKVTYFTPPVFKPSMEFRVVAETPLPPEMPVEAHATSALMQLLKSSTSFMNRDRGVMLRCQPAAEKMVNALLSGAGADALVAEFGTAVEAQRIGRHLWAQQLRQCGALMTHCRETLPMEQRQRLDNAQPPILLDLTEKLPLPKEVINTLEHGISSADDFFAKLLELIELIKNGYLAGYEHIIAAYSDFFADFNKEITANLKDWIRSVNDGKEVEFLTGRLKTALEALINKYSHPNPGSVLFPAPGKEGASKEEADNWRKALGLPDSCLKENADGTYSVVMDIGPLSVMLTGLPDGHVVWDTAKFQAWQTGFNAQEERMKNMLQSFTQKYSNANSYHDNFNKTLSAHLSQYADMLKAMLNF